MVLSDEQLVDLDNQGFLVLPDWFREDEVNVIRSRLPALFAEHPPGNIIEKSSGIVRTSMGIHLRDEVFASLARHPPSVAGLFAASMVPAAERRRARRTAATSTGFT